MLAGATSARQIDCIYFVPNACCPLCQGQGRRSQPHPNLRLLVRLVVFVTAEHCIHAALTCVTAIIYELRIIIISRNYHEFQQGQYDFSGRDKLTQIIQLAGKAGLFFDVRIGPYVCAGLSQDTVTITSLICARVEFRAPAVWLMCIDGILFRDADPQWEQYMGNFVQLTADTCTPGPR